MNILIYRYGSICEPDIIDSLIHLGHTVTELTDEIYNKKLQPKDQLRIINDALSVGHYDFVFTINFFPTIAKVCEVYKLRYISWSVDCPVMEYFDEPIKSAYNRAFLFDYKQYLAVRPFNPDNVFFMPLATNIRRWNKQFKDYNSTKGYNHDVAFVGSLYTEKCPYDKVGAISDYTKGYLNAIMKSQSLVYGYYFIDELLGDEIINDFKKNYPNFYSSGFGCLVSDRTILSELYIGNKITSLERNLILKYLSEKFDTHIYTASDTSKYPLLHNHGTANTHTEMPFIFRESKINLSPVSKPIKSGIPLRVWDVLGCGGFCLMNYQEELPEYFVAGQHLDYYGSLQELEEKIEYYLSHEKERTQIAQNGYELVAKEHSYDSRLKDIIDIAFSI